MKWSLTEMIYVCHSIIDNEIGYMHMINPTSIINDDMPEFMLREQSYIHYYVVTIIGIFSQAD